MAPAVALLGAISRARGGPAMNVARGVPSMSSRESVMWQTWPFRSVTTRSGWAGGLVRRSWMLKKVLLPMPAVCVEGQASVSW